MPAAKKSKKAVAKPVAKKAGVKKTASKKAVKPAAEAPKKSVVSRAHLSWD